MRLDDGTLDPEEVAELENYPPEIDERYEKKCSNCGAIKPYELFYRRNENVDGRMGECKTCVDEKVKAAPYTKPGLLARNKRDYKSGKFANYMAKKYG
jgi:hypothetical protein